MSILSNWVVKLGIFLAIVGLLAFNGVEVLVARIGGQSDAQNAAYAAANTWASTRSISATEIAAKQAIPPTDKLGVCKATDAEAATWVCTVTRPVAHSILMSDIGSLKKYLIATETADGSYSP